MVFIRRSPSALGPYCIVLLTLHVHSHVNFTVTEVPTSRGQQEQAMYILFLSLVEKLTRTKFFFD